MCWVYSWGGEGRAGVLGIFLGWWGSGWCVGYIPGVVRVGLVCWVYSWGGGGRVGLVCWVYSWGGEGRAGVLGIFLGW